tara:strand:- start:1206 stop:2486 length:1281 start_codon:yes stop_codon:yes gene_type:complete
MFKELLGNLYPYINQTEAMYTIIYAVLFWTMIGFTGITILMILPLLIVFGVLYFYYYKLAYKDFPDNDEIEKLEDKIINRHSNNLLYSHHNEKFTVIIDKNSIYNTELHWIYVPSQAKSAPTIVIIHGTASSATCLSPIFKYLNKYFNIYALDLPGFGRSHTDNNETLRGEIGVLYYVTLMKEFFKTKKLKNIILVGHSWGAYISAYYSIHFKEHVKQLMLIEPPGLLPTFGSYGAYWAFVFKYKVIHLPSYLGKIGLMCAQSFFHLFKYNTYALYSYILNNSKNNWGPDIVGDHITYKWTGGYWNNSIMKKLINIPIPFTVFYGENDLIIPKEQKQLLDKLYPESCVILKNASHSPHTESPKELCLKMFLTYKKMKNRRKHIKIDVKTVMEYFVDLKHLENFKTSFNPSYTERITKILYNKHYLL